MRKETKARFTGLLVALSLVAALTALAGCGGSGSSEPSEAQLEAAKRDGEEAAREKDRLDRLARQVHRLKKRSRPSRSTVTVEDESDPQEIAAGDSGSDLLRVFHVPSGNVACEILADGALCSVGSIATTFAFSGGQSAHTESGAAVAADAGELVPYGDTVSAGSVTCSVPLSSEPRGVVCTDSDSGHGFEASRVAARQHVY